MSGVVQLFKSLRDSTHPDRTKRSLLEKIASSVLHNPISPDECTGLFRLLTDWSRSADSPDWLVDLALNIINEAANRNYSVFRDWLHPNLVIDLFDGSSSSSCDVTVDKVNLIKLVDTLIALTDNDGGVDSNGNVALVNVTKGKVFKYLKDHGWNVPVAVQISRLYKRHPKLLFQHKELSLTVVNLLSSYKVQNAQDENEVKSFEEVASILRLIYGNPDCQVEIINESLMAFYTLVNSADEEQHQPSPALAQFVSRIPTAYLNLGSKTLLEDERDESKTVVAMRTMIHWLASAKCPDVLRDWSLNLLKSLKDRKRNSILIEIAHSTTRQLIQALTKSPQFQSQCEEIFFFLLLGFQHSESVFHSQVIPHLPEALKSQNVRARLSESAEFLMDLFPGYPELYNPVKELLSGDNELTQERVDELKTLSWLSPLPNAPQFNQSIVGSLSERKRRRNLMKRVKQQQYSVLLLNTINDEAVLNRSETGFLGLINLGNTCYMNSVLQALYITKDFSDRILSEPIKGMSQRVLHRLQLSFAHLRLSQRSIYSPAEFLREAKPPWFEDGRQQDSHEFFRYLLDTLHEQEKSSALQHINNNNNQKASNQALDVISEDQDEEMSQDYFGSRTTMMEIDDIRGSRTSLGSNNAGLKRWTTEENLSFGGSKADLFGGSTEDRLIHDSHSNSTDSGIQSVGDQAAANGGPASAAATSTPTTVTGPSTTLSAVNSDDFPFVSLVHQIFGGRMRTVYKCSNCASESIHDETFTELHLAIPSDEKGLNMTLLIEHYLKPELLQEDNKYDCDKCRSHQDAEKTVTILEGPEYLLCTLVRFKYDRNLNRKSKVFTDVDYELQVELTGEVYELYAVVIHSGYSSDGGHYYTYARELFDDHVLEGGGEDEEAEEGGEAEEDWFMFNDSKVSFSDFNGFKNVFKQFPRDTAYQLFYKRKTANNGQAERLKRPLRADLKSAVEKDNLKFMREKERSGKVQQSVKNSYSRFNGDDNDGGGGYGGGMGSMGGPRLVF